MGQASRRKSLQRQIRQGVTPEQRASGKLPPWTPWAKMPEVDLADPEVRRRLEATAAELVASTQGTARPMRMPEALDLIGHRMSIPHFQNSRYHVAIDQLPDQDVLHLDIRTRDKAVPGPERWRDFQRIKNELVGTDFEACELYPAEDRLRDAGNNFHLWVLPRGQRFPFGFSTRIVSYKDSPINRQAPLEDEELSA